MKTYKADLHIHTKLSPCASEEMTPGRIAQTARDSGLDIIAICDHNSSRNAAAVQEAGIRRAITVLPGIEIETRERVHVIGVFPGLPEALAVSEALRATLPEADETYRSRIGEQVLLSSEDEVAGLEERALASPSGFSLSEAVALIKKNRGLAIPAHVERPSFSVYSQFGDVPRDLPFDALEVSPVNLRPIGLREKFARYGWPLVASSDSHYLSEIGRARTSFVLDSPSFEEIRLALQNRDGRSVFLA